MIISEPVKVENIAIAIKNLPARLSGTKIVQLSDFHYDGMHLSDSTLQRAIDLSNEARPDLVVITGDFVTNDPTPIEALASHLSRLESRFGIFGCLGNHDLIFDKTGRQIIAGLERVGIEILWNQVAYPLGDDLAIVGLPDFWSSEFQPATVLDSIPDSLPRIVLSHNPDSARVLKQWRVDLQLSGHTHGGQIVIPNYGPVISLLPKIRRRVPKLLRNRLPYIKDCARVTKNWQWSQGWHQVGKNQLYINRGMGSYLPGRINCPPEVTVITLEQ